jgi:cyclopropane-fatty-acyl-phospholipid synthase
MLGETLRRLIKHGRLTIIRPDGHTEQFGELTAAKPRPDVAVRLKGALTSLKLLLHPDLYFGELYVEGALIIERGTLWDLLELLGRNQLEQRSVPGNSVIGPLQAFLSWVRRGDSRRAARRQVAHLSFPKIPSARIRVLRQNQRIIPRDARIPSAAWNVCRRPVQAAAPA